MGAVLTIGSLSLAANGRTLTGTISGGTGTGYAPASGVTDISVSNATGQIQQGTATISGSTVTIPLSAFAPSTDVLTFTITTGSNLTDSGANTAQGQSGVAVTNGSAVSATTANNTNADLLFVGNWSDIGPYMQVGGQADFLATTINGTDCNLLSFGGSVLQISIDGGAPTSVTVQGSSWTWVSVFSGLSAADHTVYVAGNGAIVHNSPAMSCAGGTGYKFPAAYTSPQYLALNAAPFTTYASIEGGYNQSSYGGYPGACTWTGDGSIRFAAAVTDIYVAIPVGYNPTGLFQDGVLIATGTNSSSASWVFFHLGTGLDGLQHEYEIAVLSSGGGFIGAFLLVGGTGLAAVAHTRIKSVYEYGDSIVAETFGGAVTNATQGATWIAARAVGARPSRDGISGAKISTGLRDDTGGLLGITAKPTTIINEGGVNDLGVTTIGAVGTPGTFTGDYYTMLTNENAAAPAGTLIICEAIKPDTIPPSSSRPTYNSAIQSAISSYNGTAPACPAIFIPTDNWLTASSDFAGAPHPNAQGYAKIANRRIPILTAQVEGQSSYTAPSTAGGTAGSPSPSQTITLANGATFTGDQTVTITSDNGTDVLTPSVGSPGTGAVTVTPANGATSFTYTVNRSAAGTSHLSYSVNTTVQAGWASPSNTTYTAVSATRPLVAQYPVVFCPSDQLLLLEE